MAFQGRRGQRGQALLLVLVFLAAFLVLIWAALRLAGAAFLGLGTVQADTRTTYALDAGVAYGLEQVSLSGNGCTPINPPAFTLNYPSGNLTVAVSVTVAPGCNNNGAYDVTVSVSGTSRVVRARIDQNQNGNGSGQQNPYEIAWAAYQ